MRVSFLVLLLASSGVSGFLITPGGQQRSSFTSLSDSYSDAIEATSTDFNENAFLQQMDQDKEEMKDFDGTSLSPFSQEHVDSAYERSANRLKDLAAASKKKHAGLNENAFFEQMHQDQQEMEELENLYAVKTTHHVDVYDKAASRLQTLAAASIVAHGGEQMEQEVAATKSKNVAAVKQAAAVKSKEAGNPSASFAIIGVALAAAAVSQNPDLMDQISHFDPSTLHFDNVHVQELVGQMTIQLAVMKESFESQAHQLAEAVQIDAMKEAMITAWHDLQVTVATQVDLAKEFATVQMAAVEQSVHDLETQVQASTPMLTFKELVAAQTATLQDSVLPNLKASLQDMTDSTTAFVQTTWDRTGSTLHGALANLQVPTSDAIQEAVAARTANLENAWQTLDKPDFGDLSAQMASVSASLETSMHQARDSVQANMDNLQGQLPGVMGNMQQVIEAQVGTLKESAAGMQATMDAQVGDLKDQLPGYTDTAQAQLSAMSTGLQSTVQGGVDSVQSQLPGVVNNVQQTLDAQVGGLKESASGLQSVMDAQVGDLKEQLPGVMNYVQQTLDAHVGGLKESASGLQMQMDEQVGELKHKLPGYTSGAQAGAASVFAVIQQMMHNTQEAAKEGMDSVQMQLPGVMDNVQKAMDAQVGGLKESASGFQSAMDAQLGDLTESLPDKMESLSTGVTGQVSAIHNSVEQVANEASLNMPKVDDMVSRATEAVSASAPKMDVLADKLDSVQETIMAKAPDMAANAKGASSAMREHLDTLRMNIDKVDVPTMPNVDLPKVDIPKLDLPKVDILKMESLPTLPKVDVAVPNVVADVPKVSVPAVTTAAKSLSDFDISASSSEIESFFHSH